MKTDNAQLAAFAAVLSEGSFEAAAQKLHVTPSAISQRIRLLEERTGQVLIQRTIPCRATAAGQTLARFAEQIALLEAETLAELGIAGDSSRTRLAVAVNADSLDSWFMSVFEDVLANAAIELDLRVEDQDHSARLLREGTVMAAVSASADAVQGCSVEQIGVMRYRAVTSPAMAKRCFPVGVDADALARAPMLTFNRKDELQLRFIGQFTNLRIAPPTHYVPSTHAFLELARRGLGWGMIPDLFLLSALHCGELVEIAPGRPLDVPLYWHRWRLHSPALDTLTRAVMRAGAASLRTDLAYPFVFSPGAAGETLPGRSDA